LENADRNYVTTREIETANSKIRATALYLALVGALVALDQFTKYLVIRTIPSSAGIDVISGFFNLVHVTNTGGAFSLFAGSGHPWTRYVFEGLNIAVAVAITFAYGKTRKRDIWIRTAYVCVAGGAIGNVIDRIRLQGKVTDFLQFHLGNLYWPVFNVADAAISIGAVMLLISMLKKA
jgi:signal peptidase II